MSPRPYRFALKGLLTVTALVLLGGGPADAYPDARVEAKITPNFGALLSPPVARHRRHGGWTPRYHGRGWRPPTALSGVVDCGDPRGGPTPITDALDHLAPGATLYIRGAAVCRESVDIWQSVTLVGEGGSAFDPGPPGRATIAAPAGRPCVAIAPGVRRVELRDLQLVSERGGRSACLEAEDAEVALIRSGVVYAGGDAAVYVGGGRLILRDASIEAMTAYAALVVDGAALTAEDARITAGSLGMDLSLSGREPSRLTHVQVAGPGPTAPMGRRAAGLLVRGSRDGAIAPQRLAVADAVIEGWGTGVWLDLGAAVDVTDSHVRRTQVGVLIDGASASVTGSGIGAREIGVQVAAGRARIDDNDIYGYLGQAIAVAPGAEVSGHNRYWPRLGCSGFQRDADCRPMGLAAPEMRDNDNGWGPAPAMSDPQPPRRRWGR